MMTNHIRSRLPAPQQSSYRIYSCRIWPHGHPVCRACSASDRKRRTGEKAAGGGSAADVDESPENGRKSGRNTCLVDEDDDYSYR